MSVAFFNILPKGKPEDSVFEFALRDLGYGINPFVVKVRRSSDDDESDFTAAQILDGTLTSFCGAGDGFVSMAYDQKGLNNGSQIVLSRQMKIVNAGALILEGNKPALQFNGAQGFDFAEPFTTEQTNTTMFFVARQNALFNFSHLIWAENYARIFTGTQTGVRNFLCADSINTRGRFLDVRVAGQLRYLMTVINTGATLNLAYINSVQKRHDGTGFAGTKSGIGTSIGYRNDTNADFFSGTMQEIRLFKKAKESQRLAIETEINNYYNIF